MVYVKKLLSHGDVTSEAFINQVVFIIVSISETMPFEMEYCFRKWFSTSRLLTPMPTPIAKLNRVRIWLFRVRYSLRRVAPLKGGGPRYVAIFSYVEDPGMVGSPERTKQLYGRVFRVHMQKHGQRSDQYID